MHGRIWPCVVSVAFLSIASAQTPLEYRMGAGDEDLVRIHHLKHAETVQDFQEIVTLVRSIGEIRRVFTYNAPRAVVLRGTASQMALADWLIKELDQPVETRTGTGRKAAPEYRMPAAEENVVRVYYVQHAETVQSFQELATAVRSTAELRRVFTYNARRAVALRGTDAQMAAADWLFKQLDRPDPVR